MTPQEVQLLAQPETWRILQQYSDEDPVDFALEHHGQFGVPVHLLAQQLACRRKAARKLPSLCSKHFLFESTALEQASSEATAVNKTRLMRGQCLFDCTGGLGVDTLLLSRVFTQVVYCEKAPGLVELFRENAVACGATGIEIVEGDCALALASYPDRHFDWVYIDPSRRGASGRTIALARSRPDLLGLLDLMKRKARRICVKASPALETKNLSEQLPGLVCVTVVSVSGECRETLLTIDSDAHHPQPVRVEAQVLDRAGDRRAEVVRPEKEAGKSRRIAQEVGTYLFEPDAAVIRAGCSDVLAQTHGLSFVNGTVDYLTGDRAPSDFPGRVLRVEAVIPWSRRRVQSYIKEKGIAQANLARRDFAMSPEKVRVLLALGDGGADYFFFTRSSRGSRIAIHCSR